jgi:hypothetical protein
VADWLASWCLEERESYCAKLSTHGFWLMFLMPLPCLGMLVLWVFVWPELCGAFMVYTMRLPVHAFMIHLCSLL